MYSCNIPDEESGEDDEESIEDEDDTGNLGSQDGRKCFNLYIIRHRYYISYESAFSASLPVYFVY